MSINGRISVDAIFHDTDGTASISVVALNESQEYSSGVVAVITGTASGVLHTLPVSPTTYRDAAGNLVGIGSLHHVVLKSNSGTVVYADLVNSVVVPPGKTASFATDFSFTGDDISIYSDGGTASYTIILYGQ
jgi:hypothetical protein